MWIDQTLLFSTALALHTGFGLVLGILVKRASQRIYNLRWLAAVAGFTLFIYLPSCLAITGLEQLSFAMRLSTILISGIPVITCFVKRPPLLQIYSPGKLWNTYPAISMLLIAAWGSIIYIANGTASGAPLAVAATVAGLAALQRQYESEQ